MTRDLSVPPLPSIHRLSSLAVLVRMGEMLQHVWSGVFLHRVHVSMTIATPHPPPDNEINK